MTRDPRRMFVENVLSLSQYENGLRERVLRLLKQSLHDINGTLMRDYSTLTRFQRARIVALFKRTDAMIKSAYKRAGTLAGEEALGLARLQSTFAEEVMRSIGQAAGVEIATTRLTANQLEKITEYPIQGLELGEWWETAGADMAMNVRRHIQLGLMQGEPVPQIVNRIAPVSVTSGPPSALLAMRRETTALVRTVVTAISAETQFETFSNMDEDVTDSYQYVATLDDRTTEICASLDGQVFKYEDESAPRPPMHVNCRSTIIPVVNWDKLGVKPPEDLQKLTRASMGGPTSYRTYSGWLRDQPADVQNEVLGASRARLFRAGKASLKDLVRSDGTTLTLPQLARRLGIPLDDIVD